MVTNELKNTKGITLIALVVTILVLLILTGTVIAVLTGENRTINKSYTSKKINRRSSQKRGKRFRSNRRINK